MLQFSEVLSAALDNAGRSIHVCAVPVATIDASLSFFFSLAKRDFGKSFVLDEGEKKTVRPSAAIGALEKNGNDFG